MGAEGGDVSEVNCISLPNQLVAAGMYIRGREHIHCHLLHWLIAKLCRASKKINVSIVSL
jgi:hypothetical protein